MVIDLPPINNEFTADRGNNMEEGGIQAVVNVEAIVYSRPSIYRDI